VQRRVRQAPFATGSARAWAALSAGLSAPAASACAPDLVRRVTNPEAFARREGARLPFTLDTALGAGALAALGLALRSAGLAPWLARLDVGAAMVGAAYVAEGDLPPFGWPSLAAVNRAILARAGRSRPERGRRTVP
jgi:hypothetical protein